jgi:hypothetical protein
MLTGRANLRLLSVALVCTLVSGCGSSSAGKHASKTKLPAAAHVVFASDQSAAQASPLAAAIPQGTRVASLGDFSPSRDGFQFENYGFIAGGAVVNQHVMRELYGDGVCADAPSDSCTLVPVAQQDVDLVNSSDLGGHCYGFSVTALRFFTHRLDPAQFGGSTPFSLPFSTALGQELAYGFTMQYLDSVQSATLTGTPSEILADLERALPHPDHEVYTLAIRDSYGPNSEGHAITPFGVENLGGGKYDVLVYDNNWPGETRAVSIDTSADTWRYEIGPGTVWSGRASDNPMRLMPLTPGLGIQPCPFCHPPRLTSGMVEVSLGGDPDIHGHLSIVSNGRRLGYFGGRFVDQIKGARVILPVLNQDWRAHPEPLYEVPAGTNLVVNVSGAGPGAREPASVRVIGPAFGATVSNVNPTPGTTDQIRVSASGTTLSLRVSGRSQVPKLALARDRGRGGTALLARPTGLMPGSALTVTLPAGSNHVGVAAAGAGQPVLLTVQSVGAQGAKVVQSKSVGVSPGHPETLSLGPYRIG